MDAESTVDRLLRDFDTAERGRAIWNGSWEEVARKVFPQYSTSFYPSQNMIPGVKRNQEQYDVTAMLALPKFGAAMEAMLTPSSGRWQRMRPMDPALRRNRVASLWYDEVTDLLFHYRYSPYSGFQANIHDGYLSIGAFGTGCIFTDAFRDPTRPAQRGLRYRNVHLGELYFATNHQGQVDKVYRRFKMTIRQIVQKWGLDKLPDGIKESFKAKPETELWVIHSVCPNTEYEPGRIDRKGMRFASHYILKESRHLLEEGGYRTNPYAVARYMTAPNEIYGRGPAMMVLPSIKTLNEEKKIILKQGHRTVDPILLMHDDGVLGAEGLRPGQAIGGGVSADGRPLVHTLPVGNIAIGKELMDDERMAINDAFLVTIFQILIETPRMTATEVLERAREKGSLLSPTMGRYQSESLGPMTEREFDVMLAEGLIPPPPQIILDAGAEWKIEYDAPLNRAMRAEEAAGGMRTFQWASEIAAQMQDPSILDAFDMDTMIPELADINAMPARWMRSPENIAARRQGRQSEQTDQQMVQALPGMAAVLKAAAPRGTAPGQGQAYGANG